MLFETKFGANETFFGTICLNRRKRNMNCQQYLSRVKNEESCCLCQQADGLENSNYQQWNSNYSAFFLRSFVRLALYYLTNR